MMKHKTFSFLLAMFMSMVTCVASAHDFSVNGIFYNITSSTDLTVSVTYEGNSYSSYSNEFTGSVVIPKTVTYSGKTYSVTSIGSSAFRECSGLTSVTIGNSVTSIGSYAFRECSGLTSVTIGNSVTSIGSSAFEGCSGLTRAAFARVESLCNIKFSNYASNPLYYAHHLYINGKEVKDLVIPNSVTSIGDYAFSGCSGLTAVTIPNSVTSIGDCVFSGCSGLISVTIPNSVTSIGESTFTSTAWYDGQPDGLIYVGNIAYEYKGTMPQGTEIVLKEGTVSITGSAFFGCSGLNSVTIPNSVTSIGSSAFRECSGLTSVTIPSSVTSIGWYAFSGCSDLTSVTIPNSVTSIGVSAFRDCSSLTSVSIPNSVTSIGLYAFEGCSGLTSVTIGNSVTSIGSSAFRECSGLTSVTINSNAIASKSYSSSSTLSRIFGEQVKEYVFGDEVGSIGSYACYNCTNITSVTIPSSVTTIEGSTFKGCSSLTSVTIPNSVTSIGSDAFSGCSDLTSVTIPNSVSEIGSVAFYGCSSLTSVTIPNSVTSIGSDAFSGCSSLISVTINSNAIASKAYSSSRTLAGIFGWQVNEYTFGDDVTSIGDCACYNYTNLKTINIGGSVTSIGNSVFYSCSGLTSITIPNSVTSIGNSTFLGCSGLTTVTIPENVNSIGISAFSDCSGLTSVTIPNSVTSIGSDAFSGTAWYNEQPDGLVYAGKVAYQYKGTMPQGTEIVLKEGTVCVTGSAFSGCRGLTSVTIPNSVTEIGSSAFSDCIGLTSVTINSNTIAAKAYSSSQTLSGIFGMQVKEFVFGDGVNSIGSYACYYCTNLVSVTIPNSVTSIGYEAFFGCRGLTSVTINSNAIAAKAYSSSQTLSGIFGLQVKKYVFGDEVKSIGSYACYNCKNLASVIIPSSVTSIDGAAFSGCSGLTSVTIPNSVTSIGGAAFSGCSGLSSVTIPNSVTTIESSTFKGCSSLTSVTIPNSVTEIGSYAFDGCSTMTSLEILGDRLTSFASNALLGCDACSIYVKKGTESLLGLWAAGYVPYDITTHEQLVAPGVSLLESTASTLKCNLINPYEEYAYQLSFDGQPVGSPSFYETGLEPDHEYTVSLTVAEDNAEPFVWNVLDKVKTAALELTPQQPKVVTEGNVVVEAASNIQNDAEKVGVEWRRLDWTDDFPSNSATAYLFNGTIQGYIRNLNTNYLWKFRAFYESASGNRYYSGWMGIDPTNTSYFEPTVHTYAEHSVEGNTAQVRGYAQRGSENVTAQGFMYWVASAEVKAHRDGAIAKAQTVPADAVQVEAKGTVMQTSLEGLDYNTTYNYVAFMTTSDGETYYGEQQTFTIGEAPTPVESVDVSPKAACIVAIYDASGRKQPRMQHGVNIVRMSDGTVRKIMMK